MKTQVLIDRVVQQTMVFIAHLATAGGVRAPLARVANQVFLDLTAELQNQGVKKKVIADMFGMALRTYHRKSRELSDSRTDTGKTLWEAVLEYLRERRSTSAAEVGRRFQRDDSEILRGVLNDLVNTGLVFRSGRGDRAIYRVVEDADWRDDDERHTEAYRYVAWLTVYQRGPLTLPEVVEHSKLPKDACEEAIAALCGEGRVQCIEGEGAATYQSRDFDVPFGTEHGWEAAVLDHFQAMVGAIGAKLRSGRSGARADDTVGGSTWSVDVWQGHPHEQEALSALAKIREELWALRERIDHYNQTVERIEPLKRVVYYMGQYVRDDVDPEMTEGNEE